MFVRTTQCYYQNRVDVCQSYSVLSNCVGVCYMLVQLWLHDYGYMEEWIMMIIFPFQSPYRDITYTVIGDDEAANFFEVNLKSGNVKIKRSLNEGTAEVYKVCRELSSLNKIINMANSDFIKVLVVARHMVNGIVLVTQMYFHRQLPYSATDLFCSKAFLVTYLLSMKIKIKCSILWSKISKEVELS